MSDRERCIKNLKSVAPLDLYATLVKFGNENLGHIWNFTPDEVMKIMTCLVSYCVAKGEEPKAQDLIDIIVKTMEWAEGDCGVRLNTWAL